MPPLASPDDPHTNSTPVPKDPVPEGGYVTRQLAGQKRFDDNDDVLNFKYPRLSENTSHPPPLRLPWNDEPELGNGSQISPPHVPITQAELDSRVLKSIPRALKRGGQGQDATKHGSIEQMTPPVPAPGGLIQQSGPQPQSQQHRQLLQGLLQQPSPYQHQQRPPLLQPQLQPQEPVPGPSQQSSHFPPIPDRPAEKLPPPRHNHQQPRSSPTPSLSPSLSDHESRRRSVPMHGLQQLYPHVTHQLPPHQHQHQHQYQQVPLASADTRSHHQFHHQPQSQSNPQGMPPYQHQHFPPAPAPVDVRQQYQFHHQPQSQPYPQGMPPHQHQHHQIQSFPLPPPPPPSDMPQPYQTYHQPPSMSNPQAMSQLNVVPGPSGIHCTPQTGADGLQVAPSRNERKQEENQVAYDTLLVQLIQNVYRQSAGRILTQQEAVEAWNQLDDQQKSTFHKNVCTALAQVHGRDPPAGLTSQPANIAIDVQSPIRPDTQGDEHFVTSQGYGLGFGFEEMEEERVSPAPNRMDLDEEMTTQDSDSTIGLARRGEEDVAMRNVGKNRGVSEDEEEEEGEEEEYPLGVDGFGLPVNDTEDNEAGVNQARKATGAVTTRPETGLRTDHTSNPLLLVLLGKFGTLVDAINRQTDAIQSMEDYVEESRKILTAATGKAAEGSSATANSAVQNVVSPGIARKIQDRVAQITGQVVERSSGDADKDSLKLLKERVRSHLLTLLGVPCLDLLAARCRPFTDDEIAGYLADDGSVECSPHSFRIDFQREWKRFSFNKEAREVFIENFIDVMMGSGMKEDQTIPEHLLHHDTVGQVLDAYVTGTLRRKYKELLQLAPGPREGEGDEEAKQRVQAAQKKHEDALRKAARISRRTTTFVARNVVIAVTPSLQRHSVLFARLTASNMSEDESDGPRKAVPRKFRIILADWQSKQLRELLWDLDQEYRANWENTPKAKRRPGNTPRERKLKSDSRSEPGVAAQGLWRNCYNPDWVSKLTRYDRNSLRMIDSDYDFLQVPQNAQQTAGSGEGHSAT